MDTLTHIVLGACIGEAIAGRQLGKKALFIGAFANSIPDLDFFASFWLPTTADLLAHRGFTHSFLFVALITPLLAWVSTSIQGKNGISFKKWCIFWGVEIFLHLFIDSFNAYGTGLFEPFYHYRVSFNSMFVADPLYSMWLAFAFIALLILKRSSPYRRIWMMVGLGISTLYFILGICFKLSTDGIVSENLKSKHLNYSRFFSTPTPLNNLLWYIVAETDSGYYIGYKSVLEHNREIDFHFARKNDSLLQNPCNKRDLNNLVRFSNGYHTAEMWQDTLVFNDLRFGEIAGWSEKNPRFVFYYFLQQPDNNKLLVQRGRFANWNKQTFFTFLNRINGKIPGK